MPWSSDEAYGILLGWKNCAYIRPKKRGLEHLDKIYPFVFTNAPASRHIAILRAIKPVVTAYVIKPGVTAYVNARSISGKLFPEGAIVGVRISKKYLRGHEGTEGNRGISAAVARLPSLDPRLNDVLRLDIDGPSAFKAVVDWYADVNELPNLDSVAETSEIIDDKDHTNAVIPGLQRELESEASKLNDLQRSGLPGKDVDVIAKRRVGQGPFRKFLKAKFGARCCISGLDNIEFLIASHIVPWSKSTPDQKTDWENGLLLSVSWDAVFDKGYISFDQQGYLLCAETLDEELARHLGISTKEKLAEEWLTQGRLRYLSWHRENVFRETSRNTSL